MCVFGAHALIATTKIIFGVCKSPFHFMTMLLYSGQFPTIPPDASSRVQSPHEERRAERERGATSVVLGSAGEGDGPWIILKTSYYLFKKP